MCERERVYGRTCDAGEREPAACRVPTELVEARRRVSGMGPSDSSQVGGAGRLRSDPVLESWELGGESSGQRSALRWGIVHGRRGVSHGPPGLSRGPERPTARLWPKTEPLADFPPRLAFEPEPDYLRQRVGRDLEGATRSAAARGASADGSGRLNPGLWVRHALDPFMGE